jgi:hypothetical protein
MATTNPGYGPNALDGHNAGQGKKQKPEFLVRPARGFRMIG